MNVDRSPNDSFLNSSFADRISNEQIPHLTVSKPRKVVAPIKNSSPNIPSQPKSIDFSTLSVLVSTVQANEKDVLYFAISLVYRDDPAHIVYTDTKRFSELEATTKSLRALHMKSNLPRVTDRNHNPSGSSYTSAASEELRISLQKFFDVATLDPNVSKNPDLISITGLKTLLEKVKTGAVTLDHGGTILTVPNQSFSTVSNDRDGDFALDGDSTGLSLRSSLKKPTERTPNRRVSGLKESFSPQSTHSSPSPTPLSGLSTPNAAYLTATFGGASKLPQNIRKQFIECYNLLDTEHACAVGIDTLQSFVCSFPHEPASEEVLELYKEIDREHTGTIDPAGFLWIIERLLASSQTKPEDVIHNFHRSVCTDLFHLMGDRISIGDFTDIIENISNAYAIPFDEIYSNIRSTWEERRTARISGLNDSNVDTFLAGSTSNSPTVRRHGSMRHSRSSMTLGHPPHPQQQIISSMEQLIKDMSTESQEYQTAIHALRRELTEKEEQIKSLQQELTEAQAAIKSEQSNSEALQNEFDIREKEKDETIDRLLHRIDILQEDLEEEMGKEPENVIEELANTYLLVMPSDLSERTETLLIERPGALLYQLDPPRRPLKLTMDVCARVQPGSSGEYIVCRDSAGHRALAVTIHNCFLTIGVEDSTHSLPQEKWFHLTFKFYWDKHVTDCSINDQTIWSIPFRDRFANEISSLDIFPREVVTVVYRNIRFLL